MPYTVKIKNQAGEDVNYAGVEYINVPLAAGSGNAVFTATYDVALPSLKGITFVGGKNACYNSDYILVAISDGSATFPDAVAVTVDGVVSSEVSYGRYNNNQIAVIDIPGACVTGNVAIAIVPIYE